MEYNKEYVVGRYRVVEQIEKVKDGYEWRVTAYDEEMARELPWNPPYVVRFDARRTVPTPGDARRELDIVVGLAKREIAKDMQQ